MPSFTANYTPTALSVAASKTTFAFGTNYPNTWIPADSTTLTNDGSLSETLIGSISTFTQGGNTWALSPAANGVNQIRAQYSSSSAAGPWTDISAYATNFVITNTIAVSSNLKLYFRIQSPTTSTSTSQFSSTLTVTAQ